MTDQAHTPDNDVLKAIILQLQGARLMLTTYGKDKVGTAIYHVDKALAEFGVTVEEHGDVPPPETPTRIN